MTASFPGRPDHPDFWLLAQIIQDADAVADNATQPFEDQTGAVVDPESLRYMAMQRAMRGEMFIESLRWVRNLTKQQRDMLTLWVASTWMDGFYMGTRYQLRKQAAGEPSIPDSPESLS